MREVAAALGQGKLVAYPTEAVFGLGCDPLNEAAVLRLLALKQRSPEKGLILIAGDFSQLAGYLDLSLVSEAQLQQAQATWPGPVTWVFPASQAVPTWIRGNYASVAVRVTAHPEAAALCQAFGGALVSTSANIAGKAPVTTASEVAQQFQDKVEMIVNGNCGDLFRPTPIRDILTGTLYRKG